MRDDSIDSLKFVLIFIVILGHLLGEYLNQSHVNLMMRNFIYLFHMPLFVFVSGYFSKNLNFRKGRKGLFKLLEIFITIQVLVLIFKLINDTISWSDIITPWWIMWYLVSLIYWRLIVMLLPKFPLYISFIISLLSGFVFFIGYPFSLSRTLVFLPFFILGYYAKNEHLEYLRNIPKALCASFLLMVMIGLYFIQFNLHSITSGAVSYFAFSSPFIGLAARLGFIILAISMSICFINLVPTQKTFTKLGKDTLLFYIYHGFIVIFIHYIFRCLDYTPNLAIMVIISVLVVLMIYLFSKFRISKSLLNPITSIRNIQ